MDEPCTALRALSLACRGSKAHSLRGHASMYSYGWGEVVRGRIMGQDDLLTAGAGLGVIVSFFLALS